MPAVLRVLCTLFATTTIVHSMATTTTRSSNSINPRNAGIIFHWFRHGDLRLHDNPALSFSSNQLCTPGSNKSTNCGIDDKGNAACVVPIFIFDSKIFGANSFTPSGSLKCGPRRAKFIVECVSDLRQQIQSRLGSKLLVACGEPADIFDELLTKFPSTKVCVVCQEEVVKEEKDSVQSVRSVLRRHCTKGRVHEIWGSTMYDIQGMPYNDQLKDMPDGFTAFRTKVEKKHSIAKPLPIVPKLPFPSDLVSDLLASYMPTLADLGYTEAQIVSANTVDPRGVMDFRGGETMALARMQEYIWDQDLLRDYFDTRNGMIGADYSSKFSPWLAHGCLSPRRVVMECRRYEELRVANKSTYWLVFEILWRDFSKFLAVKHGNAIFFQNGIVGKNYDHKKKKWTNDEEKFIAWKEGRTGYPLVDANMREMQATGFMSNRGRQNVASFLAFDLALDWRCGGDWFESQLIDYDVYSNWVNWCAAAGLTGGRLNRFNIVKQGKDYDQHGDYVRLWIPELQNVPTDMIHEPWRMTQFQQIEYKVRLGVDYPHPIVPPPRASNNITPGEQGTQSGRSARGRKPNTTNYNRHQKYEMNSLKTGNYEIR